ncbi:uncharacterized protein [Arachis hypogaea]|uniref:uncharacterized protein n=1 Tax=Arachis hypogaea TaxID=3818 RepID=UPI003B2146C7
MYMTPLELVFVDIWGLVPVISKSGFRYYISFVDAHSKYTCIFLLTNKSQSLVAFQNYKTFIENQTGQKIKALQTDLGTKFMSHAFTDFLATEGYDSNFKGYKCMAQNGKIYMARHVLFHEHTLSYQKLFSDTLGSDDSSKNNSNSGSQLKAPAFTIIDSTPPSMSSSNQATKSLSIGSDTGLQITSGPLHDTASPSHSGLDTDDSTSIHKNEEIRISECHPPSASHTNSPPNMIPISGIETSLPSISSTNAHLMTTRSKSGVFKLKALTIQQTDLLHNIPRTVAEALQCSYWREAMDKEFAVLQKCKTWELTEPPANAIIIGSKWVFAIKKNAKGDILRYKTRLVRQVFIKWKSISVYASTNIAALEECKKNSEICERGDASRSAREDVARHVAVFVPALVSDVDANRSVQEERRVAVFAPAPVSDVDGSRSAREDVTHPVTVFAPPRLL